MNSIKNKENTEKNIEDFFNKYILPLNEQVIKGQKKYFDLLPQKNKESYFDLPIKGQITYYTFYDISSKEDLRANLDSLWNNLGDEQIAALSDPLAELAILFKEKQLEQSDELSPYIYAMF